MVEPSLAGALFLILSMGLAGVVHVAWLKSRFAQRWKYALDHGLTVHGKRLFGDNKTVAGLMAMPLASAAAFVMVAPLFRRDLDLALPDTMAGLAGLGFATGLAFMLAELPNSFLKRQLDISPGEESKKPGLRFLCFLVDRFDSSIGALLVLSLFASLGWKTWVWALGLGTVMHALFSVVLYFVGIKRRAL